MSIKVSLLTYLSPFSAAYLSKLCGPKLLQLLDLTSLLQLPHLITKQSTGAASTRVVDPDPEPDPDPYWIRIQSGLWIRIRIRIRNPDPDPGGRK